LFVDKSDYEFEESKRKKEIYSVLKDMHGVIISDVKIIEDEKLKKKIKEVEKKL
jgi:hypothetical protein